MKKFLSVILVLITLFSFASCKSETPTTEAPTTETTNQSDYLFKNLSFDTNKPMEENVLLAKDEITQNTTLFEKQKFIFHNIETEHSTDIYKTYHTSRTTYNEKTNTELPTANYRTLSYSYIFFNNLGANDSLVFDYQQSIEGEKVATLDIDFIVKDVENILGKIKYEKEFRKTLELEKEKIKDENYSGLKEPVIFKTESGVEVRIESKCHTSDYAISINAHHLILLNEQ